MKCSRPNCPNKGGRGKRSLCDTHWRSTRHGYVESAPVIEHYQKLRDAGLSLKRIAEMSGLHRDTLSRLGTWTCAGRVEVATSDAVLSIPLPARVVDGGGMVNVAGTRRRIQALMLAGYTMARIGEYFGVSDRTVHGYISANRRYVTAKTAAAVQELCAQLWMTPGGSEITARRARRNGWYPFLAWDDIDNPDATPNVGQQVHVPFLERYAEVRELGLTKAGIAEKLGIQLESLDRQLSRHQLKEAI